MFLFDIKEIEPEFSVKKILSGTQGLSLDFKTYDKSLSRYLVLELRSNADADLFHTLCCDLMESTKEHKSTNDAFSIIQNRLERWSKFLKKGRLTLLSDNEIQGLFCELEFLKFLLIEKRFEANEAVISWEGPNKQSQDFIFSSSVVEVKSTTSKSKNKVRISSEHQLHSDHRYLYLRVYSVSKDMTRNEGQSLRTLIKELSSLMEGDLDACSSFEDKLYEAGYIDLKEYDKHNYIINQIRDYKVSEDFPCITPNTIMQGVVNTSYDVILSSIVPFRTEEVKTE